MQRILRTVLAVVTVVGLHLLIAPTAANADPVRQPGCKTVTAQQKWKLAGATAYGQTRTFRWCWTGGTVARSKIYGIKGTTDCWSNGTFQDRNCKGPTDRYKIEISPSRKAGPGAAEVYFWFQSRNCATGPLSLVCSGWAWHGARYRLNYGGGWSLADADV